MRIDNVAGPDWELPLLRSNAIAADFMHGFTTRAGGVSRPPYDSFNLGGKWGDAPAAVAENRRRLALAAGGRLVVARQVHGATIVRVGAQDDARAIAAIAADGLCSDASGLRVAVFTADCIPALLVDPRSGAFAAVHAGWRGTVAGVLPAAVTMLAAEFAARPHDIQVALGPAIGPCCFEVGAEVAEQFRCFDSRVFDSVDRRVVLPSPRGASGKRHVDLKAANRVLLERAGVAPAAIDAGPECTHCDSRRWFSFRRDGAASGQMMGFVGR